MYRNALVSYLSNTLNPSLYLHGQAGCERLNSVSLPYAHFFSTVLPFFISKVTSAYSSLYFLSGM